MPAGSSPRGHGRALRNHYSEHLRLLIDEPSNCTLLHHVAERLANRNRSSLQCGSGAWWRRPQWPGACAGRWRCVSALGRPCKCPAFFRGVSRSLPSLPLWAQHTGWHGGFVQAAPHGNGLELACDSFLGWLLARMTTSHDKPCWRACGPARPSHCTAPAVRTPVLRYCECL